MLGSLLIWPIKAAVSWTTWYIMRDMRGQLYRLLTAQFYKMLMPSYSDELNLSEWIMVNRKAARKITQELTKKQV